MTNRFYFQLLQPPEDNSKTPAELPNLGISGGGMLTAKFRAAARKDDCTDFERVEPFLWTPRAMYGAEYENGGFEDIVSKVLATEKMSAAQVNVEVNLDIRPSPTEGAFLQQMGMGTSIQRAELQEKGIEIPEKRLTSVYIIAPEKDMAEAVDMVRAFAAQEEEPETHRGLGFNRGVVYQGLTDKQKEKAEFPSYRENNVGWFEIVQGIFFTIDREMFERARVVFGAGGSYAGAELPKLDPRYSFEAELQKKSERHAQWLKETDASLGLPQDIPAGKPIVLKKAKPARHHRD